MNKIIFIFALALLATAGCSCKKPVLQSGKIQDCPEVMIINKMPQIIDDNAKNPPPPSRYYIYKGVRREIAEFDSVWVSRNCDVEQQVVY
ncbi:MAG: hypothetical protein PHO94_06645 [Petrimonas sp.]|nr:hypothetical protein [Petrimonas sp.]